MEYSKQSVKSNPVTKNTPQMRPFLEPLLPCNETPQNLFYYIIYKHLKLKHPEVETTGVATIQVETRVNTTVHSKHECVNGGGAIGA